MPQGAPARKVVRRISVSGGQFSEWEVCTDQAGNGEDKFDIKVCQVGQACRLKEDIASFSTIQNRQTTSCSDLLTDLLKNNRQQYVRLFDSRTNPCDFSILAP
uniref:Uncharacterized protein n=1 Tax=Romanomermis culicivorax TaxID=13658 RepID=A0A915J8E0_ROMCU